MTNGITSTPDAERTVLGAILVDNQAFWSASEFLVVGDFFTEAHRRIWLGMCSLAEKSEPIDLVTLKNELARSHSLEASGGVAYIAGLVEGVPRLENVAPWAKIIREASVRRQLIAVAATIVSDAGDSSDSAADILDRAEQAVFQVSDGSISLGLEPISNRLKPVFEDIERVSSLKGQPVGIPTGFPDIDRLTGGLQKTHLVVLAGRPGMGKSTLSVNMAVNASKDAPVAIFSMEMSKDEIVTRMVYSEARVDSSLARSGRLQDSDWSAITAAHARLQKAPIFVDDTSSITPMQLKAKCRRLKSEHGLGLVLVDYLQLMHSGSKTDNRQNEVASITRALKAVAMDLGVPVLAMAQLSRASELRTADKRPQLSDLRECVSGDSVVTLRSGAKKQVKEISAGDVIAAFRVDSQKTTWAEVSDCWPTGRKPSYTVSLKSGRSIVATGNHPFYTEHGWKRLDAMAVGERTASVLNHPETEPSTKLPPELARLLGYMAGNGTMQKHRGLGLIVSDKWILEDIEKTVSTHWPEVSIVMKKQRNPSWWDFNFSRTYENGYGKPGGNPMLEWFRGQGLVGARDLTKRVPGLVMSSGRRAAIEFLIGYLVTDGCVRRPGKNTPWAIRFDSISKGLLIDVQDLLARIGVVGTVGHPGMGSKSRHQIYRLYLAASPANLKLFAESLGDFPGKKGDMLREMLSTLDDNRSGGWDGPLALPKHVSKYAASIGAGWKYQDKKMRRSTCRDLAIRSGDRLLETYAFSDVIWDEVESITESGTVDTFDLHVPATGAFLCDGVVVHNSGEIENSANIVMFMYRETAQGDGGPMPVPITELIVAKNRSGPVGIANLRFFPEFTRYESAAPDGF